MNIGLYENNMEAPNWTKDEYLKYRHEGGEMMFDEWVNWLYKQKEDEQSEQESIRSEQ